MPQRRNTWSDWVRGEASFEIFRLVSEWLFLSGEFSSLVAVHDDDCFSATVEPALGFFLGDEVGPSAD